MQTIADVEKIDEKTYTWISPSIAKKWRLKSLPKITPRLELSEEKIARVLDHLSVPSCLLTNIDYAMICQLPT
jgi:hypothetical protein